MRVTDAKIKRILEKDYSEAHIAEGQEWYTGQGVFLDPYQTKQLLLELMESHKLAVKSARMLRNAIDEELAQYRITDNLFQSVLDLGERLSIIELYAEEYIRVSRHMNDCKDELESSYSETDDDLPF